jgi:signal transduction histidine kinase
VRNSLLHAGDADSTVAVSRVVTVSSPGDGVEIVVRDDGRGFNSRRIPPERLGVRVSILNRMATLPGGWADIESSRGFGTRVSLVWSPEEIA